MGKQSKAEKKIDQRIDAAFNRTSKNIQIPIMKLTDIMNAGRKAIAEGRANSDEDLDAVVRQAVAEVAVTA